tara:strand:+ start:47 stop:796 length:750 start_codon:yes stop_codon:yes gene_type:complete
MRNILARGGVEFIAVVLGITISFWLDNQKEEWNNRKIEINLLESIISDIESIKTYNQKRSEVFELDNAVMDYVSTNWESLNVDSIAIILSTSGYKSSIHNMFFDYREFHPPISSLRMVLNDGSINLINSKKVKSLISKLINTDYGFISKNVDSEIALQIELRNIIMKDNTNNVILPIETTSYSLIDRFNNGEKYINKTKEDLKAIQNIDYMRNYLSLKIRQRRMIMTFIFLFNRTLNKLEEEIIKILKV